MNSDNGFSTALFETLNVIWAPTAEAYRSLKDFGGLSLKDAIAAVEQAGYVVDFADLPQAVGGFAKIIEGRPFIVVNRARPAQDQLYTLVHELGHAVLHLDPQRKPSENTPFGNDMAEFQAHIFAVAGTMLLAKGGRWHDLLKQNPDGAAVLFAATVISGGVLALGLIGHLWSRFSGTPSSRLSASK